ncbi:hypothetical protein KSF78_0009164 [Schistosoma japonicum]|nr:hypothetical protein KSF78_0009164 [Schistosoma japonicum]
MYPRSDGGVCTEIIFSPADVQQSAATQNSHVVAKSTLTFTFPFVFAYDGHHIKNLLDAKYEEYNTHMNLKVDTYEATVTSRTDTKLITVTNETSPISPISKICEFHNPVTFILTYIPFVLHSTYFILH